jgi:hypothetical protein
MTYSSARALSTAISLLAVVLLPSTVIAQPFPPEALTDVAGDDAQPAGTPILIRITLTNTGKTAIGYWSGGPARYPDARNFSARITDDKGKTREVALSNGQNQIGSGRGYEIRSSESVTLPAALEPLPAGSYTIQVGKGKSAKVIVKADPQLIREREKDILKRIRLGEPFAQYLVRQFPAESVTRALLQDLLSEDRHVALHAARTLDRVEKIPADAGAVIKKAMRMHLDAEEKKQNRETNLLIYLAFVAANIGSDDAMSAVLALAHSDMGGQTRGNAISSLGRFRQEEAAKALRDLLKDKNEEIRFEAARTLARRKDAAAVDVLLAVAGDQRSRWRGYAYVELPNYPSDPRVEPALKSGLNDEDDLARSQAQQALRELRRNQKQ